MRLNIYTNEQFTDIRETRERDKIKIPFRVAQYVLNTLAAMDFKDDDEVLHAVLTSEEQLTAVVRATFGLAEDDLDFIDAMELYEVGQQIVAYVIEKMAALGISFEDMSPNAKTPAPTA